MRKTMIIQKFAGMLVLLLIVISTTGCSDKPEQAASKTGKTVFSEDFENYQSDDWEMTDSNAWALDSLDGNKFIALIQQSEYEPPHRSPININLIKDVTVEDFTLTLKAKSTKGDYDHRDLCIFFGYQDSANFYYTHLGMKADAHAHSIFIVDDTARVSIAAERTDSLTWGELWHDVKVVRNTSSGLIEVYYDNMDTPIMKASDKTFVEGRVGIGSFDDTGYFDDISLTVPEERQLKD